MKDDDFKLLAPVRGEICPECGVERIKGQFWHEHSKTHKETKLVTRFELQPGTYKLSKTLELAAGESLPDGLERALKSGDAVYTSPS